MSRLFLGTLSIAIGLFTITRGLAATDCDPWIAEVVSAQGTIEAKRHTQTQWIRVQLNDTYCAGDSIRAVMHSRAGLLLRNQTVLRLDQGTTIVLPEFEEEKPAWLELIRGAAHLISNIPYRLKVKTPFINAAIEGTEFALQVTEKETRIWVFEGTVVAENAHGRLSLENGDAALAEAGKAPMPLVTIKPRDAVQWALYYPPIIDYRPEVTADPIVQQAIDFYRTGQIAEAIAALSKVPNERRNARYFTLRAGLLLSVGRVEQARNDINQAQSLEPNNATSLALLSVIALAQNQKEQALDLAQQAAGKDPQSPTPQVALSYAYQAAFDIETARDSIKKALELSPDDPLAWARLSELELSLGELDNALEAAERAAASDPDLPRTQMVLGFAHLTQIDLDEATAAFQKAIELDPAAPLPRLGQGLVKIRRGDVEEGTKDIEVAAILDPDNSLVRSYLGKAYYEEKRGGVASREFAIAKELDPKDPTPWFYDAILKQTTNRPVEALHDMQKAIELNDNRGVYRSKLLLDDDLAARSTSLGRIYSNLGFEQVGLLEGWKSQNVDPSNYSVHRLLADNYSGLPRHQIARVSELLQSQLLQPLNITPVQPQLAESNLLIFDGLGPANPAFNEFNPLFARNRLALQASGIFGSNDTYGDEVVQSGLYNRFSYSLGQFHYQTGGFRPNSDLETDIYNVFIQTIVSNNFNIQFEYRRENSEAGDLRQLLDQDFLFEDSRQTLDRDSARVGFNFRFTPNTNLLGNFSYGKLYRNTKDPGFEPFEPVLDSLGAGPLLPFLVSALPRGFNSEDEFTNRLENWSGELQFIGQWSEINLISGISHVNQSRLRQQIRTTSLSSRLDPNLVSNLSFTIPVSVAQQFGSMITPSILAQAAFDEIINPIIDNRTKRTTGIIEESSNENHTVGYTYTIIDLLDRFTFTLGGAIDSIDRNSSLGNSLDFHPTYVNPKVGLIWHPFEFTTLRGAWFKSVKRPFGSNQTIEPTFISGFNQFFDDSDYSRSTRYGFGINQKLSPDITFGGEISWRKLKVPRFILGDSPRVETFSQDEEAHRAYAYWTPTNNLALSAEYFYESFDRAARDKIPQATPLKMTTHRVPISLTYFHEGGIFGSVVANYIDQSVTLIGNTIDTPEQEDFWVFDATIGYRLPRRLGIITFGVKNIFDNRFKFQDTNFNIIIGAIEGDLLPPSFVPERVLFGQFTLAF